ncbi:hypothetical protein V498_10735 [Pseudogymnoascus sp. VKM F-4517 (FW-2822)]|nr:hypothetical protein V498_10735 [Pseudogymnoascus sp. VKM F-4517 (FW-2822)]
MPYPESARGDRLFSLKQYVCVVTGGETGIGLMAAQALIANGARVYIVSSNHEALVQTAKSLQASQGGIVCEVTNKEDLMHLVGQIEKRERYSVNLVVSAAGSEAVRSTLPNMNAKELQQMLFAKDQTSWISTFNTNVIACTSHASKAATIHLSKMMAYEFKDFGMRVNCIAPSYFPSNDKEEGTADNSRPLEEQTLLEPVGEKKGTESEIVQAVLFLAKNRFVTGEVLNIDNGEFLRNSVN